MTASFQQNTPGFAARYATVCLFLLPVMALTTSFGLVLAQFAILLGLSLASVRACYVRHFRTIAAILLAFAGYFLVSLWRYLAYEQGVSTLDGPSRLLFGLSCIGFVVALRPSWRLFCIGLCLGVIGAGLLALVQRLVVGMERVDGYTHHPITFGDLALAMGLLAWCSRAVLRQTRWAVFPWLALAAGMLVSILSASRGGWLALPLVLWPMLRYGIQSDQAKTWLLACLVVMLMLVLAYILPFTGVAHRIAEAVSDVQAYMAHNDATTSVGIRLELWKASWRMFLDHPWVGVGRKEFDVALLQLAQQGFLQQSPALTYSSSHNDALHFLATGGLLDFSCLLMMYAAPLLFFIRILRQAPSSAQNPALMGLVLVLCFIGFGLTDVMFWLMRPKVFYIMMICTLVGFCLVEKESHD
jgi:O-antigen ligase